MNNLDVSNTGPDPNRSLHLNKGEKNPKLIQNEKSIHFLAECLKIPSTLGTKRKLCAELAKVTQKLTQLIDKQLLTNEDQITAKNCLILATACLDSNDSETPIILEEMPLFPTWLKNDISVTDKQLALVVGDPYAKTADLEGGHPSDTLTLILNCLQECPDFLQQDEWLALKELYEGALAIESNVFIKNQHFHDRIETLQKYVDQAFKDKKELLFPGGWTAYPSGHAMYYKIIPQQDGKYSFQVYNRGAGLQYHASVQQDFKKLYSAFIEIGDIERDKLLNPYFLRAIIEHKCYPENSFSTNKEPTRYNEDDIYQPLLSMLGGKEKNSNLEMEDLMSPQRTGTCAWKSSTAVNRNELGYISSKKLKLRIEAQALWSNYLKNKATLHVVTPVRNHLLWAITSVSNTLKSMQELISPAEYTQLTGLLAFMENTVIKAQNRYIREEIEYSPLIPVTRKQLNLPTKSFSPIASISTHFPSDATDIPETLPSDLPLKFNKWEPKAKTLASDLKWFCSLCDVAESSEQYSDINIFYLQIMRRLPVPSLNPSTESGRFWNEVIQKNQENIPELMKSIADFASYYYTSCFSIEGSLACPPERTHAVIKALHIQNILKLHSPLAQMGFTMPGEFSYLEQIFSNQKFRELHFRPTDPLVYEELACIYEDLKKMAAPFGKTLEYTCGSKFRHHGLVFEWNNDLSTIKEQTPYFIEFNKNTVNSEHLNPEFIFIRDKIKNDPEFFKIAEDQYKKIKKYDSTKQKSFIELEIHEQIAFVYSEGQNFLPKLFLLWRDQVMESRLMLYGSFSPPIFSCPQNDYDSSSRCYNYNQAGMFDIPIISYRPSDSNVVKIKYYKPKIINNYLQKDYKKADDPHFADSSTYHKQIIPNRYAPNIRPLNRKELQQLLTIWQQNPQLTENEVYSQTYPTINLPLQQKRELLTLGTNKDLQIEETVAYFSKNIHLLKERDYQTLFHMLLFEKNFLLIEMEHNPRIISHLQNLIRHGYELAHDHADIETCVFFINLSRHLQPTVSHLHPEKEACFLPIYPSLTQLLTISGINHHDMSLIYQELIASFSSQDSINTEEIVLFIRAQVFLSMHPIAAEVLRPDKIQEQRDTFAKFHYLIQERLEALPNILNEALACIITNYQPGEWQKDGPNVFKSTQKYYYVLTKGDFFQKSQPATSLPIEILTDATYQLLFKRNFPAKRVNFNTYEFNDGKTDNRIIISHGFKSNRENQSVQSDSFIFQRKIDGKWYELKVKGNLEKIISPGILMRHHAWLEQDLLTGIPSKNSTETDNDKDYSKHIQLYNFSGVRKAYAIIDNYKGRGYAEKSTQINTRSECKLIDLKRYPDNLIDVELSYIDSALIKDSALSFLIGFEDPTFIDAWNDDTGTARLIELPRFNLTFVLDTQNPKQPRWSCSQIRGYYLAANQINSTMGLLTGYFILENKNKEKQILLPLQFIDQESSPKNPVFSEKITKHRSLNESSQRYASYRLDKGKTGDLVIEPTTAEAGFYLAYLKLAIGHYDEARYFLSLHRLPLRGSCDKELDLLRQTILLDTVNHDSTGPGAALRLHATYLYLELLERTSNSIQEDQNNVDLWTSVAKTYETYVNQIFNVGSLQLPVYEEKIVLHTILRNLKGYVGVSSYLINYLQKIDPEFSNDPHENLSINTFLPGYSPHANDVQRHLLTIVEKACNTPHKSWTGINQGCVKAFCKQYCESSETFVQDYLVTRPKNKGLNRLLVRWMKKEADKDELLEEISNCLKLSALDTSAELVFRAVLEMICRHPNRYTIAPPPMANKLNEKDYDEEMSSWLTKNILPIMQDYVLETQDLLYLETQDLLYIDTIIAKKTPTLKPSSNTSSIRKTKLPSLETGYVKARPEGLIEREKLIPVSKVSAFKPTDLLVALPESEIKKIKEEKQKAVDQAAAKAEKIFSADKPANRCVANEYKRLREDCEELVNITKEALNNVTPMTVPQDKLHELQEKLNLEVQDLKISLRKRKKILRLLVNPSKTVSDSFGATIKNLFLAGKKEKISIDKLILLYARGQLDDLAKSPSSLQQEDIALLQQLLFTYLEQATHMQQLQRALEKTEACIKQLKKTAAIDPEEIQKLVNELSATRHPDVNKHPACLVLEYWDNILIRQDQLDKLKLFFESGDVQPILQMIMGAGKTSTLMPILALFLANGTNLSILMLPDELLQSVFDELKKKLGEGFMQMIFPFVYGRNSDYSISALQALKNKLLNIKLNRECLISSPKSFHCLYLKTIETWRAIRDSNGEKRIELKQQFKLLREILNIFRKDGTVLMDEVDLIQDSRNEVNFPVGKTASIKERDMDLLFELYDILLESNAIKPYLKVEFDPKKSSSKAPPFNSKFYHAKIKPRMAEEILVRMKDPNKILGNQEMTGRIHDFFAKADERLLMKFLCNDPEGYDEAYAYAEGISDRDVRNLIFLAQKELNSLLPTSLQKDSDDEYGVRTQRFATPLEKGKPIITFENGIEVEGTRYADPFGSANYTYQAYYKNGIPSTIVKEQIETLQKQAIDEIKQGEKLVDSLAYKEFRELSGSNERLHLLKLSPNDLETITKNVNSNKDLRRLFIKRYVFSSILFHTRKLNSNSQALGSFFNRFFGFSGTTWNDKTYPDKQKSIPSVGTDARTIFALLGHAGNTSTIDIDDFDTPIEFIHQLPCEKDELALIDCGAYLKGESIQAEAKALLNHASSKNASIEAVVFFDDQGKKVILEKRENSQPISLNDSKIKPEKRFTIFTKSFTTGANIVQANNTIAYFTVGRNILLRDFLQGVFRLRKIEENMAIRLCVNSEVKQAINAVLDRDPMTPISTDDVIIFSTYNQANQIGEDNYISLKHKMLELIQEAIREIIFDENLNPEDAAELYTDAMDEVFAPSTGEEPFELYGGKEKIEDEKVVLDKDIKYYTKLLTKVLASSTELKQKIDEKKIKEKIESQKKIEIVPEKLVWREQNNQDQLMQVQEESEAQTEVQAMQQEQQDLSQTELKQWRYYAWPKGNIYHSKFYQPRNSVNLEERSWQLNQLVVYIPSQIQNIWNYSTDLSKKAWGFIPNYYRDSITQAFGTVIETMQQEACGNSLAYPLNEFLAKDQTLDPLRSLFDDKRLKVSQNFAPKVSMKPNDHIATPFDENQKTIRHLLVSHNTENDKWEILLLDQLEAADFRKELTNTLTAEDLLNHDDPLNLKYGHSFGDLKLCLQDLQLGTFEKGLFSPNAEDLKSKEYLTLLVKIKFLSGETVYTKTESALIKEWISPRKWNDIKNIYRNHVLAQHSDAYHVIKILDGILTGSSG